MADYSDLVKRLRGEMVHPQQPMSLLRLCADALEAQAKEIAELKKENEQLKLFRPYRTELTDCLKTMSVGDKACFPAGDEYEKRRKSILRLAKLAGVKVRTRHVMKDNIDQISVERVG